MNYDWRTLTPFVTTGPAEHVAFLDQRVQEMSSKEWRLFQAAMEMVPQHDLAGVIALTFNLSCFEYYFPAANATEAGRLLAKQNYGAREDVLPYLDFDKICTCYLEKNTGVFVDGAFITKNFSEESDRITAMADLIRDSGIPDDNNWTAKLQLSGPKGKEAWLRLPDYEEVNGGEADEVTTALHDLDATSLDECMLVSAKCIFSDIDLMAYDKTLPQLVFDASNMGYALDEYDHSTEYFYEELENALVYEDCHRLDHAIDIIINIDCYDFVPDKDLRATAENIMPSKHFKQDIIMDAFDYEAYAANYYLSRGMLEVDGGFFMRNDNQFHYDYSMAPEQKAKQNMRKDLEDRLTTELDRCWAAYILEMSVQDPAWLVNRASNIAAYESTYGAFRHGRGLSNETIEKLLQFEDPLKLLHDAWVHSRSPVDERHINEHLQEILENPLIGESYDQYPEFSGRPVESEMDQTIG